MKRLTVEEVEREISTLDGLDLKALQTRWRELYKVEPPFKIRSGFLRRAIAYRLQELVFGGLGAKTRRQLKTIADEAKSRRQHAVTGLAFGSAEVTPWVTPPRRRSASLQTRTSYGVPREIGRGRFNRSTQHDRCHDALGDPQWCERDDRDYRLN